MLVYWGYDKILEELNPVITIKWWLDKELTKVIIEKVHLWGKNGEYERNGDDVTLIRNGEVYYYFLRDFKRSVDEKDKYMIKSHLEYHAEYGDYGSKVWEEVI